MFNGLGYFKGRMFNSMGYSKLVIGRLFVSRRIEQRMFDFHN